MTYEPLVSVIIPSFDAGQYIAETIDSVLNQTYKNYEIIVVDDGSRDNTKEVLKKYIEQKKIVYIYQENGKQAAARNNGIRNAKGDLLAFLDADDIWMPNKLELQIPLFSDNEVGLVFGNAVFWNSLKEWPHPHEKEFLRGYIFHKLMIYGNFIWASTVVIRRECIVKTGFFEDWSPVEDYHMWLRVCYFYKADYVPEIIEKYRIHGENVSLNKYVIMKKELAVVINVANSLKVEKNILNEALARMYFELSYFLADNNEFMESLKYGVLALLLKPFRFRNWKLLVRASLRGVLKAKPRDHL